MGRAALVENFQTQFGRQKEKHASSLSFTQQVSNLRVFFLSCPRPYSHGLRFVRRESPLRFRVHSFCLSRVSPWICFFFSWYFFVFVLVFVIYCVWSLRKVWEVEEAEDFESWTLGFPGDSESGKWRLFYFTDSGAATWETKDAFFSFIFQSFFVCLFFSWTKQSCLWFGALDVVEESFWSKI